MCAGNSHAKFKTRASLVHPVALIKSGNVERHDERKHPLAMVLFRAYHKTPAVIVIQLCLIQHHEGIKAHKADLWSNIDGNAHSKALRKNLFLILQVRIVTSTFNITSARRSPLQQKAVCACSSKAIVCVVKISTTTGPQKAENPSNHTSVNRFALLQ